MNDTPTPTPSAAEPTDAQLTAQLTRYDPVHDVPSATEITGEPRILQPSITMFAPEVQQRILQKVAEGHPNDRELLTQRYVIEELRGAAKEFRAMGGLGKDATAVQRADADTANEIRLLQQEEHRITSELDEVRTVRDPLTGRDIPTDEKRIQGQRRRELEARRDSLHDQMTMLAGPIGQKRREAAVQEDIQRIREERQAAAEAQEAERRAEKMASEERINRIAEAKFRNGRSNIG